MFFSPFDEPPPWAWGLIAAKQRRFHMEHRDVTGAIDLTRVDKSLTAAERIIGRQQLEIDALHTEILDRDAEYKKLRKQERAEEQANNQRCYTELNNTKTLLQTAEKRILLLEKQLSMAKELFKKESLDLEAGIKEYELKPNARELAMAQSKGEFTEAVRTHSHRTGLSLVQSKEKIKEALGLGDTFPKTKDKKQASMPG